MGMRAAIATPVVGRVRLAMQVAQPSERSRRQLHVSVPGHAATRASSWYHGTYASTARADRTVEANCVAPSGEVEAVEASYEPTWDSVRGEFTWGLGMGEPHPRGQFNAFLAAADAAGPGAWTRLSAAPLEPCPQVVGVDFPDMAFHRAEWIDGNLHLGLAPLREDPQRYTSFRLVGAEPRVWEVHGLEGVSLDVTASGV